MKLLQITNVKNFMNKLLIENAFDSFLISEAKIVAANTYILDGHINDGFYTDEDISQFEADSESEGRIYNRKLTRWSNLKPLCVSMIKGKRTPISFKYVFYLADENVNKFKSKLDNPNVAIDGLSLIVRFDNNVLTITTGTVLKEFSLDKTVENTWDDMVMKFLTSNGIEFEY